MKNELIKSEITVMDYGIRIIGGTDDEYVSLTDLARYANPEEPKIPIATWLRNKNTISFLGIWEKLNNPEFKGHEFETFEREAGKNSFYLSPQKWIKETNAIGIKSKSGNNGGTFAHSEIAFEFAGWLSPEFRLYLIKEFKRLKASESYQNKIEWHANRQLAAASYIIHTDAIKENIIPQLSEKQKQFVYASEADLINVALFGMTAKEWRDKNPELAKSGNIRDYTDLLHLIILSNLEIINSELIESGLSQSERLIRLNENAMRQVRVLANNRSIKNLEQMEKKINGSDFNLTESREIGHKFLKGGKNEA